MVAVPSHESLQSASVVVAVAVTGGLGAITTESSTITVALLQLV